MHSSTESTGCSTGLAIDGKDISEVLQSKELDLAAAMDLVKTVTVSSQIGDKRGVQGMGCR